MFDFALIFDFDGQHYYYGKHERNDSVSCIYDKFDLSQGRVIQHGATKVHNFDIFHQKHQSSDRYDLLLRKCLLMPTVFRSLELVFHYFRVLLLLKVRLQVLNVPHVVRISADVLNDSSV
jgi:hypothetical protein